jgi:hypothetical protein
VGIRARNAPEGAGGDGDGRRSGAGWGRGGGASDVRGNGLVGSVTEAGLLCPY